MDDLLTHVFWFRKLPSEGPSPQDESAEFLRVFSEFIQQEPIFFAEKQLIPSLKTMVRWARLQVVRKTTIHGKKVLRLQLPVDATQQALQNLAPNQALPLYIPCCNAALIITMKTEGAAVVSGFTVHPKNQDVMSTTGDLIGVYPEVSRVADKQALLLQPEFLEILNELCFTELEEVMTKSKKAGEVVETRNVASSEYVMEWLLGVLCDGESSVNDNEFESIQKKIRQSVEWKSTLLPFRRSGLWCAMKVVLQTILVWKFGKEEGTLYYKAIMLIFMSYIAKENADKIDPDQSMQIIAKIAVRMKKLEDSMESGADSERLIENALQQGLDVCQLIRNSVDETWKTVIQSRSKENTFHTDFNSCDFKFATKQSLSSVAARINKLYKLTPNNLPKEIPVPVCNRRGFNIDNFSTFNDFGNQDSITELFDVEQWVREEMLNWIHQNPNSSKILFTLFRAYCTAARTVYDKDPVGIGRMVLTLLNMIRGLLENALTLSPMLSQYKIGVDISIIDSLLLTSREDLFYASELENYFKQYHHSAKNEPDHTVKISDTSFSVRYASLNKEMKILLTEIEEHMASDIMKKEQEVLTKKKEYDQLLCEFNSTSCTYTKDSYSHSSSCYRCGLKNKAESLSVDLYEKILPEETYERLAVVFELIIPDQFRCLREAIVLLCEFDGRYDNEKKFTPADHPWRDYKPLETYRKGPSDSRMVLSSTAKPLIVSHYNQAQHVTSDYPFIRKNALNLNYSIDKKIVALENNADISDMCYFPSGNSRYSSLNPFMKTCMHDQNMVMASQDDCHPKLSLSEFIAFGSLRAGHRLQIHNLASCIANNRLSFNMEEVFFLVVQSIWQGCAHENNWWRSSGESFHDEIFTSKFLNLLSDLMSQYKDNWKAVTIPAMVIFATRKILEISDSKKIHLQGNNLLLLVRATSMEWCVKIDQVIASMIGSPKQEIIKLKRNQNEIASCCCLTYYICKNHPNQILMDDLTGWLQCISKVNDTILLNNSGLEHLKPFEKLLLRSVFVNSLQIESKIYGSISSQQVNKFLKGYWNEFETGMVTPWGRYIDSPRWLFASFEKSGCKILLQLEVLRGYLLVNGAPLGKLPQNITSHEDYERLFGSHEYNSFITTNRQGLVYRFTVDDQGIVNIFERKKDQPLQELVLISHKFFHNDLPSLLVDNYSHWLDCRKNCVFFRPKSYADIDFTTNISFELDLKLRQLLEIVDSNFTSRVLIDNQHQTFEQVCNIMTRIEDKAFIHAFIDRNNTLTVDLPRKGLHFTLNSEGHFLSKQFGMLVSTEFNFGTLIGLQKGIILYDEKSSTRQLLIPYGELEVIETTALHAKVAINTLNNNSPGFFTYVINDRLNILKGEDNLTSWLYLALLHAYTSFVLPDPFTGLTGTESAFSILQSCRCLHFVKLETEDEKLLERIKELSPKRSFYPKHLREMQSVSWKDMSSLVQHDGFHLICNMIETFSTFLNFETPTRTEKFKLYEKAYFRSLKTYSNSATMLSFEIPKLELFKPHYQKETNLGETHCRTIAYCFRTNREMYDHFDLVDELKSTDLHSVLCALNVSSLQSWTKIDVRQDFLRLYNYCGIGEKYSTMCLLSFLAYKSPKDMNIIVQYELFSILGKQIKMYLNTRTKEKKLLPH